MVYLRQPLQNWSRKGETHKILLYLLASNQQNSNDTYRSIWYGTNTCTRQRCCVQNHSSARQTRSIEIMRCIKNRHHDITNTTQPRYSKEYPSKPSRLATFVLGGRWKVLCLVVRSSSAITPCWQMLPVTWAKQKLRPPSPRLYFLSQTLFWDHGRLMSCLYFVVHLCLYAFIWKVSEAWEFRRRRFKRKWRLQTPIQEVFLQGGFHELPYQSVFMCSYILLRPSLWKPYRSFIKLISPCL